LKYVKYPTTSTKIQNEIAASYNAIHISFLRVYFTFSVDVFAGKFPAVSKILITKFRRKIEEFQ